MLANADVTIILLEAAARLSVRRNPMLTNLDLARTAAAIANRSSGLANECMMSVGHATNRASMEAVAGYVAAVRILVEELERGAGIPVDSAESECHRPAEHPDATGGFDQLAEGDSLFSWAVGRSGRQGFADA